MNDASQQSGNAIARDRIALCEHNLDSQFSLTSCYHQQIQFLQWRKYMAWADPLYSREEVNNAGKTIVKSSSSGDQISHALDVINNWRSCHSYSLNTFQLALRTKSRSVSLSPLVSQRTKRLDSIRRKLSSTTTRLSQMQDIAGCRSVLENIDQVRRLREQFAKSKAHDFRVERNYIDQPKDDGYRSWHLVYKFVGSDRSSQWTGLNVELQMRTAEQHAWATAVEAVGTFTRQALKWRGGDADWRRFFVLMSSAIAKIEDSPVVDGTPNNKRELAREISALSRKLYVPDTLQVYNTALEYTGSVKRSDAKLLLVHMIPEMRKVNVQGFRLKDSQYANYVYTRLEEKIRDASSEQVVLVRVDTLQALQRAYPNYFLDTKRFSGLVNEVITWS